MEKRKQPRVPTECPIAILGGGLNGAEQGTGINLSMGGCAVGSNLSAPNGAYLSLHLRLADHELPVEIELAKVRWSMGRALGVEFIRVGQESQERLQQFLNVDVPMKTLRGVSR